MPSPDRRNNMEGVTVTTGVAKLEFPQGCSIGFCSLLALGEDAPVALLSSSYYSHHSMGQEANVAILSVA